MTSPSKFLSGPIDSVMSANGYTRLGKVYRRWANNGDCVACEFIISPLADTFHVIIEFGAVPITAYDWRTDGADPALRPPYPVLGIYGARIHPPADKRTSLDEEWVSTNSETPLLAGAIAHVLKHEQLPFWNGLLEREFLEEVLTKDREGIRMDLPGALNRVPTGRNGKNRFWPALLHIDDPELDDVEKLIPSPMKYVKVPTPPSRFLLPPTDEEIAEFEALWQTNLDDFATWARARFEARRKF